MMGNDFLGSLCLIHAIDSLPTSSKLLSNIAKFTRELALSRHGHGVIIRALSKASSQTLGVIEAGLINSVDELVANDFGYRTIQAALQLEREVKIPSKYSRVARIVDSIAFKAEHFKLIEYLVINFPDHPSVRNILLPNIVQFVRERTL
jgi:hypothetical protein